MNPGTGIPSPSQALRARDHVLAEAASEGRRPSVLAVARRLGMSNTSFRRHFPDLAREIGDARRAPATDAADSPVPTERDRLVAHNAKLRRENRRLREHLDLAVANLQRLTLQNHRQRQALEAAAQVTTLTPRR